MKKILLALLLLVVLFIGVLLIKTLTLSSSTLDAVKPLTAVDIPDIAIERFQKSIRYKTISYLEESKRDTAEFRRFHQYLEEAYPLLDSLFEKQFFNYSILYKWQGNDPSAKSIVMMGHFDVVPVDESTLDKWEADPFSGDLKDGKVYGRGTLDDKINVIACLEAAELLIKQGFQPKQTIYFAFGHDEEVGGANGAKLIAQHLKTKGEDIAFVIDEGGYIIDGIIEGITKPIAIINTGEKGYVSFKLTINTPGGHSSAPPTDNTIGSLAKAIVKLEENQFEYRMLPVIEKQIEIMGPEFDSFLSKLVFANSWLFESQLLQGLNAHTTTAATMISGGVKDNVIPTEASVIVNFRIMPGETIDDIRNHITEVVDDDRIKLSTLDIEILPSKVSDDGSPSYQLIERTIRELIPDVVVAPGLLGGGTDSKHYDGIADNVYRFYPTRMRPESLGLFHGNNEHISLDNFKETIRFNIQLIRNLQ